MHLQLGRFRYRVMAGARSGRAPFSQGHPKRPGLPVRLEIHSVRTVAEGHRVPAGGAHGSQPVVARVASLRIGPGATHPGPMIFIRHGAPHGKQARREADASQRALRCRRGLCLRQGDQDIPAPSREHENLGRPVRAGRYRGLWALGRTIAEGRPDARRGGPGAGLLPGAAPGAVGIGPARSQAVRCIDPGFAPQFQVAGR